MSIRREIIDCGAMGSRNESRPPDNDNNNNEEIENTATNENVNSRRKDTNNEFNYNDYYDNFSE